MRQSRWLDRLNRAWADLRRREVAHALLMWTASLLAYAGTTARDILAADSGEFQLIAAGLGIGHPPGYPLYTMASWLWTRALTLGTVPFRVNVLSAVLAATTLTLCLRSVMVWARAIGASMRQAAVGGTIAALALGMATTFWAQATTANIRMPTLLFTAWGYLAVARYRAAGGDAQAEDRALRILALAIGLGVGHHPSLAFIAVGWGVYLLLLSPQLLLQPRRWVLPLVIATLAWLIPQLYLPIRGGMEDVPLNPGTLSSWRGFWGHVLARGFGGDMFAYATLADLQLRLPLLPSIFGLQFPPVVLVAIGLGWLWLLRQHRPIAVGLAASWLTHTLVTITYRAPQTVEYMMPAYVPMALTLGSAVATLPLGKDARRPSRDAGNLGVWLRRLVQGLIQVVPVALLLVIGAQGPGRVRDFTALANDSSIRKRVAPLLETAPAGALILADWRWATPLWVMQATEDHGRDVEVAYVAPEEGIAYDDVWHQRAIAAGAASRPLLTTHYFDWSEWGFAPVGGGFRLYSHPLPELPAELGFAPIGTELGPIELLGYRWEGLLLPGRTLELQLAWRLTGEEERTPSFATRLWSADEMLLSGADQRLEGNLDARGVRFTRLTHQLPIDRCSDAVYPTVDVYTTNESGFVTLGSMSLPALDVECRYPRLLTERIWPGYVWTGGPFLRGVDYDTIADRDSTAYLHWCGPGSRLVIEAGEARATVDDLAWGECQTISLAPHSATPILRREDGTSVRLLSLPLPSPREGERYLPFGDEMVLVADEVDGIAQQSDTVKLNLEWRAVRPIVDDYAISVRLLDGEGEWVGVHDMQPGLGALPTLKWVTRGVTIRDPHPVDGLDTIPTSYAVVVYERFRLTSLRSARGDIAVYQLP
ncbi:MAG: protein O-mannosyl-transferase family [Anaerolineae bacterium]